MKNTNVSYSWALKFILAAILVGVGIYMVFAPEVVYTITGIGIVIFSVFRVVPLLKSLNKEMLRTLNLIEILVDTVIGILLIYIAFTGNLEADSIWGLVYRYALAFFFYVRGLVYFNSVVFLEEKTEVLKFWVHIFVLTLGAILSVLPQFDYASVGLLLLFISILGAGYLGYDGYNGYSKYREFSKNLNVGKVLPKVERSEKETPRPITDEKQDKQRIIH
jgi:hypothetical protein